MATKPFFLPQKEVDLLDGNLLLPVGNYKYLTVILSNHLNIICLVNH